MENIKVGTSSSEKQLLSNSSGLGAFAIKAGIVLVVLLILADLLLPDFSELKKLESPKTKLLLLSFVQNPQALFKISEIEEDEGKTDNAIREMELAVGLLEMHGASKQVIQKYADRIKYLKSKKEDTDSTAAH